LRDSPVLDRGGFSSSFLPGTGTDASSAANSSCRPGAELALSQLELLGGVLLSSERKSR
jgi:hypothetical protein